MSAVTPARATASPIARLRAWRVTLSVESLALLASAWFLVVCNLPFWHAVIATGALQGANGARALACLFVLVLGLQAVLFAVLLHGRLAKPVLALLLVAGACASHYSRSYGIYFDSDMVRNVLHTDTREAGELLTWSLLPSLLVFAGLPMLALTRITLRRRTVARALGLRLAALLAFSLVAGLGALGAFQDLSSLMRNHRELRHLIVPGNVVMATAAVVRGEPGAHGPRQPIGEDAAIAPRKPGARPRLLVLVVGETVRARNWGLDGYARQTTPQLAASDAINFRDVTSCGTSTEVSLPCMFSPEGRPGYDKARLARSESLMHVLARAGVATLWRDNQSGCKGVCADLPFESMGPDPAIEGCDKGECVDEILLKDLDARIDAARGDQIIVLHQIGDHGPSYYRRAPKRLQRFTPTCESDDLGRCSREQIVNSYDNGVLATDDLVARAIGLLAKREDRDSALIYLSDHGESLGENGLFLHGLPYAIAPDTQTRVPMVAWLSPGFAGARHADFRCLRARAAQPASHDNLFHTVLGVFAVNTHLYDASRDLFAGCEA